MTLKSPPNHFNLLTASAIGQLRSSFFTAEYFTNLINRMAAGNRHAIKPYLGFMNDETPQYLLDWLLREQYVQKASESLYQFTADANKLIA